MPRKKKAAPATEPTPIAEVLAQSPIVAMMEAQKAEPDRDAEDAVARFERQREREQAIAEPIGAHTAAVLASRPRMQPTPADYRGVQSWGPEGIRVNRGVDGSARGKAAIQFAEDRPLSRAKEYDLMTKVQDAGFQYEPRTRQWERPTPEGMAPGENTIGAVKIADELAGERRGRGR